MNLSETITQIDNARRHTLDMLIGRYIEKNYNIPRRSERNYDIYFKPKLRATLIYGMLKLCGLFTEKAEEFIDPERRPFEYIEVYKGVGDKWERVYKDT